MERKKTISLVKMLIYNCYPDTVEEFKHAFQLIQMPTTAKKMKIQKRPKLNQQSKKADQQKRIQKANKKR